MKKIFFSKKRGFTIIEILVVVAIVVLLGTFIVVAVTASRNRTRDAIIKTSLEQIEGIAETTYDPSIGYQIIGDMRGSPYDIEDDYHTIREIRQRIRDMGSSFRMFFPEDGVGASGFGQYCAYAPLASDSSKIFCIDSFGNKVVEDSDKISCQVGADAASTKIYCIE